ncbi:MAG: hypothetical protein IT458_00425 [Planctomycetes bacterium]|nr:hypothetical protein [Planctomycetota bacterium]
MYAITTMTALALLAAPLLAQGDGFRREGTPAQRKVKDALEGKAPPALAVQGWLNTDGKELALANLRGKVVLLDFWGVW